MKALLTILFSTILIISVSAKGIDAIKIAPNAKTSTIEVKVSSKKATQATIVITNENGKVVSTQTIKLINGENIVALVDVAKLAEGSFKITLTAGSEVMTTKFMNWKL